MAEIYRSDIVRVDLDHALLRKHVGSILVTGDKLGNRFGAEIFRDGKPVDVTGCGVTAYFMRPGEDAIVLNGTASGSVAYVDLAQACYSKASSFTLTIKISYGGSTTALRVIDGYILLTQTDELVDPGEAVPTLDDIFAQIAAMEAATAAANNVVAEYEGKVAEQDASLATLAEEMDSIAEMRTPNIVAEIGTFHDGYQVSNYGDLTDYNASGLTALEFYPTHGKTYTVFPVLTVANMMIGNELCSGTPEALSRKYDSITVEGQAVTFTVNDDLLAAIGISNPVARMTFALYDKGKVCLVEGEKYVKETYLKIPVPYVDAELSAIKGNKNIVNCFGDSLTMGTIGGATPYTDVLQSLLGEEYTVNNFGVGGETAQQIAGRQGGVPIVVQPIALGYSSFANIDMASAYGSEIGLLTYQSDAGFNPCMIDNVQVVLSWDDNMQQIARCANPGDSLNLTRPTILKPYSSTFGKNTLIVWSGTNGWGDNDVDTLVEMQKRMIEYNGNRNYLVIGIHSDNRMDVWEPLEKAQTKAFGYHYINIREYLVKYGLEDCSISATADDLQRIAEGKVPSSLMLDGIHFKTETNAAIANVIYKRGKELGLW